MKNLKYITLLPLCLTPLAWFTSAWADINEPVFWGLRVDFWTAPGFQFHPSDPDAEFTYRWYFGDGSTSREHSPSHTYAAYGTYNVVLKVSDGKTTERFERQVTVSNPPPEVDDIEVNARGLNVDFHSYAHDLDGEKLTYKWYFGDGTTSKEECPTHAYNAYGTYKVTLKVSDGTTTVKKEKQITVGNQPPEADFYVDDNRGRKVYFYNRSSDPGDDKLTYKWYFGDGATSKEENPTHTYNAYGTYDVTLKVSDGTTTVKKTQTVTLSNQSPVVSFHVMDTRGRRVYLSNDTIDPDDDKLTYKWDFGDGTTSKEKEPEHTYAAEGTYKVILKVSDGTKTVKKAQTVTVSNNPPVASFEIGYNSGRAVYLENYSYDPDWDDELRCKWDFGDGTTSGDCYGAYHEYEADGTYKVVLKVSDGSKTAKTAKKVTVAKINKPPVAYFEVSDKSEFKVSLQNLSSDPDGDKLTYKWYFGDGATSKELNPVHTYAAPGTYRIVLKASDGTKVVKTSQTVTVNANQAPVASFNVQKVKDLAVKLADASSDPDKDVLKYKWNFGDGTTSKEQNPNHVYEKAGTYKVSLKVSDGLLTDTYSQKIVVNSMPDVDIGIKTQEERYVRFEARASDGDGDDLSYSWDFGDGTTSTEKDPEHTYDALGEYEVVLTVSDGKENAASTKTVTLDRRVDVALRGQVVGYLKNAHVCLDFNNDSLCSGNEPVAETDGNGIFVYNWGINAAGMRGTPLECVLDDDCDGTLPLKVLAWSHEGTEKYTLGKQTSMVNGIAMSATAFVTAGESSLGNPGFTASAPVVINPFTTLTDYAVRDMNNLSSMIYNVALRQVATSFGVNYQTVLTDYNDPSAVTENSRKALITGEVLANSGLLPNSLRRMNEICRSRVSILELANSNMASLTRDVELISENTSADDHDGIADAIDTFITESDKSLVRIIGGDADEFKCGVSKTGNVLCWGFNGSGNLGDPEVFPVDELGDPADGFRVVDNFRASPVKVKVREDEFLSNAVEISAGNGHVCAVTFEGAVYCWGSNWNGQAGIGSLDDDNSRVFFASRVVKGQQETEGEYLSNVASVTLAHNSSCALTLDGEVYCWGENSAMQLGDSYPEIEINVSDGWKSLNDGIDLTGLFKAVPYPVKVNFPDSVKAAEKVVAGLFSYCAIVENRDSDPHNLYCWGNDARGLVSHNWMQYQDDWLTNYADRVHFPDGSALVDPDGTANWNWKLTEESRDFHSIYGAPVTQIRSAVIDEQNEELDIANVTQAGILGFDGTLMLEMNGDGKIWGVYNGGTPERTDSWMMTDSPTTFGGENIVKMDISVEDRVSFILGDGGFLYGINAGNKYGTFGVGSYDENLYTDWGPTEAEGGNYWVIAYPARPETSDGERLGNVIDAATGKRSVCAITTRLDDDGNATSFTDTYCWGSSTFGQLGFDNGDGGFAYDAVSAQWNGYDGNNIYYDKQTRMVISPRKVEFR